MALEKKLSIEMGGYARVGWSKPYVFPPSEVIDFP
jgi:hypothetical protein